MVLRGRMVSDGYDRKEGQEPARRSLGTTRREGASQENHI